MIKNTVPSVNVRTAKMTKGRLSVYLDFYPAVRNPQTNKNTRREYLGFYIYENPTTQFQKEYNESILNRAELIRCRRQEQLINSEFGFLDRETPNLDFLAYFERKCKGRHQKWNCSYLHSVSLLREVALSAKLPWISATDSARTFLKLIRSVTQSRK